MDNLNTRGIASLYETFPAEEAKRLRDKERNPLYPKHGSWLNMAEIELNVTTNYGALRGRTPQRGVYACAN